MKFDVFFELQTPEPYNFENEYGILWTEVEHVELAEKLGFQCAWLCEHHGLALRAHCSAPEVVLAAISQRTKTIRLGHAIIEMLPPMNHVIRVAERVATLDLLSKGRVEVGLGRTMVDTDLAAFRLEKLDMEDIHGMWREGVDAIRKLWTESPASFEGKYYSIPPCNVVPKPYQRPHPPLWNAVGRDRSWVETGRLGMGALSTPFSTNDEKLRSYREAIKHPDPGVKVVNNQFGLMIHVYCHKDDNVGLERGIEGEYWVQDRLYHDRGGRNYKHPAGTPQQRVYNNTLAFGDPQRVTDTLKYWEEKGTDRVLCWFRYGMLPADQVLESMKLFAEKVIPNFKQ